MDEAEVEGSDGPGCFSTGPSSAELGTSEETSSPTPSLSGSGEVDEEREGVGEVVEDEECGDVSEEEEAGGGKDKCWVDCGSDDSSPPADVEAADVGPEAAPPASAAPLLYS